MTGRRQRISGWRAVRVGIPVAALWLLVACGSAPTRDTPPVDSDVASEQPATSQPRRSPYPPAQEDLSKRGNYTAGGLYAPGIQDSAPDEIPRVDLIPEPVPHAEPRSRYGNRSPYTVLGKSYEVLDSAEGYVGRGIASYYGKKFHGRRTSSLEVYDMYTFSAAHKTLPLPSYARVTNLDNGKSVVVRVNDRGPFHEGRIIDLSYAAAVKLGIHRSGTAPVEVRALMPGDATDPQTPMSTLPPGVHIATGKPQPASAMDALLQTLPDASATAVATTSAASKPAPAAIVTLPASSMSDTNWRFDMRQDGRTMTADEFDAWMASRGARIATGRSGEPVVQLAVAADQPPASVAGTATQVVPASAPTSVPAPYSASATAQAAVETDAASANMVTLQIASFASHDNAQRALAMMNNAGIEGAGLFDAVIDGRRFWRLRVGPVATVAVSALTTRITRLGFEPPNVVRR